MIFDKDGYPKDVGATDYMDSARLAGLMAVFNFGLSDHRLLLRYITETTPGRAVAVRCPNESPSNNPLNFTRDQLVCLTAGLYFAGYKSTVKLLLRAAEDRYCRAQNTEADFPGTIKKFPDGADLLTPSVMNHLRICAGEPSTLLGRLNLKLDIIFNGKFTPIREPNQLISLCMVAGPEYVSMYKKYNPRYAEAIRDYWCGWREESGLAEAMVAELAKYA